MRDTAASTQDDMPPAAAAPPVSALVHAPLCMSAAHRTQHTAHSLRKNVVFYFIEIRRFIRMYTSHHIPKNVVFYRNKTLYSYVYLRPRPEKRRTSSK
jgi:hypothetical protein